MGQFLANFVLVEGPVEGGEEEHHYLGAHTDEEHEVTSRQVGELEQRTEDNDRGTP